ncbi:MAG: methyltransferase [Actinobacteria bacterium 13_2_20CM_2_71_6]|nr:MAG: methyltransferase [Actinobacteria bacterium 13_2_20CM_2_71_6]
MTVIQNDRVGLVPSQIMEIAAGYRPARTLLSAVELGVFTALADGPLALPELRTRLGLHPRAARDFLDALVAMRLLDRDDVRYRNTPVADQFLDRAKPDSYIGGPLELASARTYRHWADLTLALITGEPQNGTRDDVDLFTAIEADPHHLRGFHQAMTGLSMPSILALAEKFPWHLYQTVADVGCSEGALLSQVVLRYPHVIGIGFDLAPVRPLFHGYVSGLGLGHRLGFLAADFFVDPLPEADVLVFGHVLHDWDLDTRRLLLAKAYDALPEYGVLIVYDAMIDDDRRTNLYGLLMSLNMLIETRGGSDYTSAECQGWLADAGFQDVKAEPLTASESAVIGIKRPPG